MALKFLNKKGWHTGSLRNIENVWKAEQKHEAEQKKLEELRKQIHEERERTEQEALARVKNNPVQMAMIRKSVETMKNKDKMHDEKEKDERRHKHRDKKSKHHHSKHDLIRQGTNRVITLTSLLGFLKKRELPVYGDAERDAEVHEEQRWKRLKKAEEKDAKEAVHAGLSGGRNFLDAAQRSVYGAGKGGSSTIEESVRRRTHYSQRAEASEGNAFRR
ncbi:hypothetical protein HAX54_001315 [Datura stramonium]|uniref:CBF1-interacting co-repressor CIR N-terminal domain-containing protein n=1 Tax=Datura stramonium TaxID=4076 RepID=A0ABS8RSH2_DATST|nr:hypothetical protein [Datura stramonium]